MGLRILGVGIEVSAEGLWNYIGAAHGHCQTGQWLHAKIKLLGVLHCSPTLSPHAGSVTLLGSGPILKTNRYVYRGEVRC